MRTLVVIALLAACGEKHASPKAPPPPDVANSTVKPAPEIAPPPAPPPAQPIAALAITAVEPAKGDADGGTYLHIFGRGFIKDGPRNAKIYFGSKQGSIVRFASDTDLIVQAPGGKIGESVDVLVIFDPGGTLKLPTAFTFIDKSGGPTVDDLQPQTGGVKIVGAGTGSEGTLTSAAVMQRIQTAYFAGVKRCYTDYVKKDAAAKGKVSLTFTVTRRGKTSGITVNGFAKPVDECLSKIIATWTFPISKAKDGTPQDVSFNVALQLVPD